MSKELKITYTNHRGETAERHIIPKEIWYGSTQWHPQEQWLLKAHDQQKDAERDFALKDIGAIQEPVANSPVHREPVSVGAIPKEIKLFGDGGSRGNPGPSASGYVLMDMQNNIIFKGGVYLGITTNNQAEYQALKFGLEEAHKRGAQEVAVHMDSLLVINQMKGIFKVKNRDLWPIHDAIRQLATQFKKVTYTHVPREFNKLADAEVNTTLDAELEK